MFCNFSTFKQSLLILTNIEKSMEPWHDFGSHVD